MSTYLLVLLLMFSAPNKNLVLKDFCRGWLATRPTYRLPLDTIAPGIYYNRGFTMKERQRIWQMRRKYGISGVPYDVNGDGICNFKDFAILADYWKNR